MESTAFFEKKISLSPSDLNKVKTTSIEELLSNKAKELIENKCSENGYVLPGSVKLLSRSMGYFEAARFTGDTVYYAKLEGKVIYPADGVRIIGEVIRKNKMGLYIDYRKAIRIQVPRDLHIGSKEYEDVEIGDIVELELKRSKFQINDPYILASGIFITRRGGPGDASGAVIVPPARSDEENQEEKEEAELGEEEDQEAEEEEQEAGSEEEEEEENEAGSEEEEEETE